MAVEFDCEDPERKTVVTPTQAITNFFVMHIDKVDLNSDNGMYGTGKSRKRYEAMLDVLEDNENAVDMDVAWEALRAAAQEPDPNDITSNTQWSIIFNNTDGTAEVAIRRHWDDRFDFAID